MKISCNLCQSADSILLLKVNKRPSIEIDYKITEDKYYREIHLCNNCGVAFNAHENLISDDFYEGFYNSSITSKRLQERFDKIISLPKENSDNKNRALRISSYLNSRGIKTKGTEVIDIGTGTGVFPFEMNKKGYTVSCIDPDAAAINHVKKNILGIKAYIGKFEDLTFPQKYSLITFNKVLEHVMEPIVQLKKAKTLLTNDGMIYVELPDATDTLVKKNFNERTEFNLEHYTVYTKDAFTYLAKKSGLNILTLDRLKDPSGKHTIYAFLN